MSKTATPIAEKTRSVKLLRDILGAASLRADMIVPVKAEAPGMVCVETASGMPMWLSLIYDCEFVTSPENQSVPTASELNRKRPTVKPNQAKAWADAAAKTSGANGSTKRGAKSQPGPSSPAASPAAPASKPPAAMPPVVVQIPLEKLHRHPQNRAVDVPSCADLAERMKSGQLTPCIIRPAESIENEFTNVPLGHFQLLAGERRVTAAMINGWETIACSIRGVGDVEALRILVEENAQREDLTDIEKAESIATLCLPVDEGGAGYTREQAGAIYSLSAGAASNLVRLLELPQVWRDRVSKGELPQTFARELLPYAKHDALVKIIDKLIADEVKDNGAVSMRRDEFADQVYWEMARFTRSLEPKEYNGPKFKLDDATLAKLEVIEIPGPNDRSGEKRALNVKLWDKLQKEAAKRKADPHDQHADCGPNGKQKAAKEKPKPPTAAELAAKAKEAAERTKKAIAAWRLMFLREILAQTLDYSRMGGVTHLFDIWLDARPYAPSGAHTQDLLSAAIKAAGGKTVPSHSPATKYMAAAAEIDRNDRWKVKLELTRLILRDEVELPAALIEPLALECEIEIEEWWRKWQTEGRSKIVAELIERFFGLHTTDQLVALAGELGVGVMPGAKKANLVNTLATYHRSGRTLALPKSIAPLKAPRQSPKKGGK